MIWIHEALGIVTLVAALVVCVWAWLRAAAGMQAKLPSKVLIGLIDLQILLGIITWVLHRVWSLHPLFGIAAAAVAHIWVKDKRSRAAQAWGATAVLVLLAVGVLAGR
ncbi:hypothetical protein [Alicyclobacillus macrosporangiidus]|uniref:Uncharacterized protein n=1 Tax=Alicyclobacillus macrosporangiidus TaxID=392015 RepID=A0A1I7FL97_9BACL|nr:hypothetical protein [Alicyclobacillus macrosporangiidus]SFU36940.1 hypothetical protein SAMN05421543_101322 [Alicyclobacillus macrosporangiidus]